MIPCHLRRKRVDKILLIATLIWSFASTQSPTTAKSQQFSSTPTVDDALPDRALPQGFQAYSNPHGSGRLLYTKLSGDMNSARAVMRDSLAALKSYFNGPPQLLTAVSDPRDQVVQVMLSANIQGQHLSGVATAMIGQSGAAFGVVFDRPDLLRSSWQPLSLRLGQEMPRNAR